jgi:hypothetical protein
LESKHNFKFFIDQYFYGSQVDTRQMLSVFMEMLEHQSVEIKCQAFELLINLALHTQLPPDSETEASESKVHLFQSFKTS